MKKLNQIARKGDTSPRQAQASRARKKTATAKEVAEINEPRPLRSRKKRQPVLIAELRRFLTPQSFTVLARIEERYGVSVEDQLAAALGSWTGHVEWQEQMYPGCDDRFLCQLVKDDAGAFDPGHMEYLLEARRAEKASKEGAALFIDVAEKALALPFRDGRQILAGLFDLVRGNPAFKGEALRVRDYLDAGECLASHHLYTRAGMPLPPD
jgi:hypothetical protein